MNIIKDILVKKWIEAKRSVKEHTVLSLLWIVNIVPSIAGFSLNKERISIFAPFWIIHISLMIYIYLIGIIHYQVYYATTVSEFIKSYVNISLLLFIGNNTYWFLREWNFIRKTIAMVKQSDELAKTSPEFVGKQQSLLRKVKWILYVFYGVNYVQASLIYFPHRSDVNAEFCMTPCVGMEPLYKFPNHHICRMLLYFEEVAIATVVLNWQGLLITFIGHTAAMYRLLAEEMMTFNEPDLGNEYVKKKLSTLLQRHTLILETVDNLKCLYSIPLGNNFMNNAICISLFFYLPLEEWLGFIPIVVYCFLTFFLYCFLGQRLINAAEVFESAVYSCGWEKYDVGVQRSIYIMLMQSQKKVELLAADIIPVNICTFATTLQFMYKFFTVMKF